MSAAEDGVLRLLTWNVQDHRGERAALLRVLRAARADVVCLQEAWRFPFSARRIGALASAVGLAHLCGGRATAGTAVLVSRRTVSGAPREQRLPVRGLLTRPRGVAHATVGLPGHAPVRVSSVHLGLTPRERAVHVGMLLDAHAAAGPHAPRWVVAGDLNETPDGPSWRALGRRLLDADPDGAPTFTARRPRRRIDAVLVDPSVRVRGAGWPEAVREDDVVAASDHRPVLVELELEPRREPAGLR